MNEGLAEEVSYREMYAELSSLLVSIESTDVDVDLLAQQVARAAELVALCRARIEGARMEVSRVLAEVDMTGAG